jgi:hypothetical protein
MTAHAFCFVAVAAASLAAATAGTLTEIAQSPEALWNGVAVTKQGRLFASFPRWTDAATPSVGEVMPDGAIRPYPGGGWNAWKPGVAADHAFVSVNSIWLDRQGSLWVVDSGRPKFGPLVPGAPKLVQVRISSGNGNLRTLRA